MPLNFSVGNTYVSPVAEPLLLAAKLLGETSRPMLRTVALSAACFGFIVLCSARVHAEGPTLPAWMRVRAFGAESAQLDGFTAPQGQQSELVSADAQPAPEVPRIELTPAQRSAKRGAYMIAAGTGLIAAGVLHATVYGHKGFCYASDDRAAFPILTGAITAAAGTVMTIVGAYKMRKVARKQRHLDAMTAFGLPLTALATGAVATGALFGIGFPAWEACIAS